MSLIIIQLGDFGHSRVLNPALQGLPLDRENARMRELGTNGYFTPVGTR